MCQVDRPECSLTSALCETMQADGSRLDRKSPPAPPPFHRQLNTRPPTNWISTPRHDLANMSAPLVEECCYGTGSPSAYPINTDGLRPSKGRWSVWINLSRCPVWLNHRKVRHSSRAIYCRGRLCCRPRLGGRHIRVFRRHHRQSHDGCRALRTTCSS